MMNPPRTAAARARRRAHHLPRRRLAAAELRFQRTEGGRQARPVLDVGLLDAGLGFAELERPLAEAALAGMDLASGLSQPDAALGQHRLPVLHELVLAGVGLALFVRQLQHGDDFNNPEDAGLDHHAGHHR